MDDSLPRNDVGYVILTFGFDLEFGGSTATITELYIAPGYRHGGLGAKTMQRLEALCCELGIQCLELQVERGNIPAQAFYTKLGFVAHDRIPLTKDLGHRLTGANSAPRESARPCFAPPGYSA